jgi:hypothetical protein
MSDGTDSPSPRPAGGAHTPATFFNEWCRTGTRPESSAGLEVVGLRYVDTATPDDMGTPVHRFEEVDGIGHLVRISMVRAEEALGWPHPAARFDAFTHTLVFPGLDAEIMSDAERLASSAPARLIRHGELWITQEEPSLSTPTAAPGPRGGS